MYTIWRTGHPFNDTVTNEFRKGSLFLSPEEPLFTIKDVSLYRPNEKPPASVSYGILRGADTIFKACQTHNVEFWEIDRGYFRPGHFDGYYRISLNHTRVAYNPDIDLPSDRWKQLKIEIEPWKKEEIGHILFLPPTEAVADFYGFDLDQWVDTIQRDLINYTDRPVVTRYKNDNRNTPIEYDITGAHCVLGYNSNSLVEALIQGVPAIQLQAADILGWNRYTLKDIEGDLKDCDREKFFRFLSYSQFTLSEFAKGYGWKTAQIIQKYGVFE